MVMGSSLGMEYDHPEFYKILKRTEPEYREKVQIEFSKLGENSFTKVWASAMGIGGVSGPILAYLLGHRDIEVVMGGLFGMGLGCFLGMIGGRTYRVLCENKFIKRIEKEISEQGLEEKVGED